jgi:hypothetical protein
MLKQCKIDKKEQDLTLLLDMVPDYSSRLMLGGSSKVQRALYAICKSHYILGCAAMTCTKS